MLSLKSHSLTDDIFDILLPDVRRTMKAAQEFQESIIISTRPFDFFVDNLAHIVISGLDFPPFLVVPFFFRENDRVTRGRRRKWRDHGGNGSRDRGWGRLFFHRGQVDQG